MPTSWTPLAASHSTTSGARAAKSSCQVDAARSVIAESFPAGTRVTKPAGGFILWVEMPKGCDSIALFERLLDRGISIAPGPMFSASQGYRNCMRISLGHPWNERAEKALREVGRIAGAQ